MAVEQMRKLLFGFCIFYLITLASAQLCESVQCKLPTQDFTSGTCVYWNQTNAAYYLQSCAATDTYCPSLSIGNPNNSTCQTIPVTTVSKWPGEKCSSTSDCNVNVTSGCVDNICVGEKEGGACKTSDQCNPELFCSSSNLCIPQIGLDGPCTSDSQCVNGAGCDFNYTSNSGICVQYFSIPAHQEIASCPLNQIKLICESSLCATTQSGFAYCLGSVTSKFGSLLPVTCEVDSDCTSTVDNYANFKLPGKCQCGYNPQGYGICNQNPGDPDYKNYLLMLQKWYLSTSSLKCNTERRENILCLTDWWDANDVTVYKYFETKLNVWPYIQYNDQCSKTVLMSSYYALQDAFNAIRNTTDPDEHHDTSKAAILALGLGYLII